MDQRTDELLRTGREADREDRERIELFQSLVSSAGWKAYVKILEAKIQDCADRMMAPAGSLDGCIASEFVKGTMSGLVIARDIVSATIAAKDQLRRPPTGDSIVEWDDDEPA